MQKGHFGAIKSASFNSTDRQLVTSSTDGSIKVWDAFSQRLVADIETKNWDISSVFFSKDDQYIMTNGGPSFNTYKNPSGEQISYHPNKDSLKFYYNDKQFNSGTNGAISSNGQFRILHQPKDIQTIYGGPRPVITVKKDFPIIIYHNISGKFICTINKYLDTTFVQSPLLEFLSDSVIIVAQTNKPGKSETFITKYHLFDFIKNKEISSFSDTSNLDKQGTLLISPQGRYFIRYTERVEYGEEASNTMRQATYVTELWDTNRGIKIWEKNIKFSDASFANDDSEVLLQYDTLNTDVWRNPVHRRVSRYALPDGNWQYDVRVGQDFDVNNAKMTYSLSGKYFAVTSTDSGYAVYVRNRTNEIVSTCKLNAKPTAIVFSKDDHYLVTCYDDGNFSIWDVSTIEAKIFGELENKFDPLLVMHVDPKNDRYFFVTKNMYGVQSAQTSGRIASFSTGNTNINTIHYFSNNRYSIVDAGDSYFHHLMIVDNDTPSVIKKISFEVTREREGWIKSQSLIAGGLVDMDIGIYGTGINHPDLQFLYMYFRRPEVNVNDPLVFGWSNIKAWDGLVQFSFAVIKSKHAIDTIMLASGGQKYSYNKYLKGYIYRGKYNYLLPSSTLQVTPLSNKIKLMRPILSDDANCLLGLKPDGGMKFRAGITTDDPVINNDRLLYCLDLRNNFVFSTPKVFKNDSISEPSQLVFSPDRKFACILEASHVAPARIINGSNGRPVYNLTKENTGTVLGAQFSRDGKTLFTWSEGGTCTRWDLANGKEMYTTVFFKDHDYAIILPEGYYYLSARTDARYLNFKIDNTLYNFSQFDLQYNRPDKVLKAIGNKDQALIAEYYKAWQGRIKKSGFSESDLAADILRVPEINVQRDHVPPYTTERNLRLRFEVRDSLFAVGSYNIYVNDVPVNGINGRPIDQPTKRREIDQSVTLGEGLNKIELSCTNEKGLSSRKETLYVTCNPQQPAKPKTWFIGIGINDYKEHSSFVDLSYCVKDVRDLSVAFRSKYGDEMVIDTLMNFAASRENILALKKQLMQTSVDDRVIISFSGHGMVDPAHPDDFYFVTGTTDANNPAANGVSYAMLESLLDGIPARKKLLLLDACHSGESDGTVSNISGRIPGTKRGNDEDKTGAGSIQILDIVENNGPAGNSSTDIFKLMKEAFVDIRRNNGAYVISAAQSSESAGEGGGISNGWFTSCLIEQLKQGGTVTVNELSRRVNECVSNKSAGGQNTDNRQELAEFDWVLW
ncbi:MAG: caspase family protein [Chitinophagaceae bacterium]